MKISKKEFSTDWYSASKNESTQTLTEKLQPGITEKKISLKMLVNRYYQQLLLLDYLDFYARKKIFLQQLFCLGVLILFWHLDGWDQTCGYEESNSTIEVSYSYWHISNFSEKIEVLIQVARMPAFQRTILPHLDGIQQRFWRNKVHLLLKKCMWKLIVMSKKCWWILAALDSRIFNASIQKRFFNWINFYRCKVFKWINFYRCKIFNRNPDGEN